MKKVLALVLALTLIVVCFAGCGKKEANSGDVPTLIWYVPGDNQPGLPEVMEAANKIVEKEIGAKIDMKFINQGDFDEKMRLKMAAGEDFDLCFTGYINVYAKAAEMGVSICEEDVFWDSGENEGDPQKPGMPIESYNRFYPAHNRYDAVICYNTHSAIYFCARAKEDGIRVPEDMYVIGRGGLQLASAVEPSITTISCNEEEVGQQIVKLYRYLLSNPYVESATILLNCSITPRESTGCFPVEIQKDSVTDALLEQRRIPSAVYKEIDMIETMFKNCTKMDLRILSGLRQGVSREKLAEQEFTTISTVRYRLKRMLRLAGLENKKALFDILDKYNIKISASM